MSQGAFRKQVAIPLSSATRFKSFSPLTVPWDTASKKDKIYYLSLFVSEVICRIRYPTVYNAVTGLDQKEGKFTPDFRVGDTILEFKGTFKPLAAVEINILKEEIKRKYGPGAILVYFNYTSDLMREEGATPGEDKAYRWMLDDIRVTPGELREDGATLSIPDAHRALHKNGLLKPFPTIVFADPVARLTEYALKSHDLQEFLSKQVVSAADIPSFLTQKAESVTIHKGSNPFDRDITRHVHNTISDIKSTHGWKANRLHVVPPDKGIPINSGDSVVFTALANNLGIDVGNPITVACSSHSGEYERLLEEIKTCRRDFSITKTVENQEKLAEMYTLYKSEPTRRALEDKIAAEKQAKLDQISGLFPGIKFDKHGNVRVRAREKLGIWAHEGSKSHLPTVCEMCDWFENYNPCDGYMSDADFMLPDHKGAYSFSTCFSDTFDKIGDRARAIVSDILSSTLGTTVRRQVKFYRALLTQVPKVLTKGLRGDEAIIVRQPNENWFALCTAAPNDLTTGAIMLFYKGSSPLRQDLSDGSTARIDDIYYWVTKPFRLPWIYVSSPDEYFGSFLGTTALLMSEGVKGVLSNPLYSSIWLRPSLELLAAFDVSYLFLKTMFQRNTFGRAGLSGRISKVAMKDIRAATILHRLRQNLRDVRGDTVGFYAYNLAKIAGSKSPLFGWEYTTQQSCLVDVYLKSVMNKSYFKDSVSLMANFFKGEAEHQIAFKESEFGPDFLERCDTGTFASPEEILKKILKTTPNNPLWQLIVFDPIFFYGGARDVIREAMELGNYPSPVATVFRDFLKSGTASKTMLPCDTEKWVNKPNVINGTGRYPALESAPQKEAFIYTDIKIRELSAREGVIRDLFNFDPKRDDILAMRADSLINSDTPLTMLEVFASEALMYRGMTTVCMVLKHQKGFDKRAFFVQSVWSMTAFRLLEGVVGPILMNMRTDIIHVPGNKKYTQFQLDAGRIGGGFGITEDQKKFGDTYIIRVFELMVVAMRDEKYIPPELADMCMFVVRTLYRRIELMPPEILPGYLALLQKREDTWTSADRKHYQTFSPFISIMNNVETWNMLRNFDWAAPLENYPALIKDTGFILGVLNNCGSFATAVGACITEKFINNLLPGIQIRMFKQSDDGATFCSATHPSAEDWEATPDGYMSSRLLQLLVYRDKSDATSFQLNGPIIIVKKRRCTVVDCLDPVCPCYHEGHNPQRGYHKSTALCLNPKCTLSHKSHLDDQQIETFRASTAGKIIVMMGLLTSRLVGCCPSLDKWGTGIWVEILQSLISMHGDVVVPLVRYTSAIGANMPGLSYGSDLSSVSSRVYDLVCNKGTALLTLTMEYIANFLVMCKYGMPTVYNNRPINAFGSWWALPGDIQKAGLVVNECRLLGLNETDSSVGSYMMRCLNTKEVWSKRESTELRDVDADHTDENTVGTMMFHDIQIRYMRELKAQGSYKRLVKVTEGFYEKFQTATGVLEDQDVFHKLNKYLLGLPTKSIGVAYINQLTKHKSYSYRMQHNKIDPAILTISQLGFPKRIFTNPFVMPSKNLISVEEVWDTLGLHPVANTTHLLWEMFKDSLRPTMSLLTQEWYAVPPSEVHEVNNTNALKYKEIHYVDRLGNPRDAQLVIAAAIDFMSNPDITKGRLARFAPTVSLNTEVLSSARQWADLLLAKGVTPQWAADNFRTLTAYIAPFYRETNIPIEGGFPSNSEYLALNCSVDIQYKPNSYPVNIVSAGATYKIEDRLCSLALGLKYLTCGGEDAKCILAGTRDTDEYATNTTLQPSKNSVISHKSATVWMVSHWLGHRSLSFFASNKSMDTVGVTTDGVSCYISRVGEKFLLRYWGDGNVGINQVIRLAAATSYFCHPKGSRFERISQLSIKKDSGWYMFDQDIVYRPDKPYSSDLCLDIRYIGPEYTHNMFDSVKTSFGYLIDTGDHAWTITPWNIEPVRTNVSITFRRANTEITILDAQREVSESSRTLELDKSIPGFDRRAKLSLDIVSALGYTCGRGLSKDAQILVNVGIARALLGMDILAAADWVAKHENARTDRAILVALCNNILDDSGPPFWHLWQSVLSSGISGEFKMELRQTIRQIWGSQHVPCFCSTIGCPRHVPSDMHMRRRPDIEYMHIKIWSEALRATHKGCVVELVNSLAFNTPYGNVKPKDLRANPFSLLAGPTWISKVLHDLCIRDDAFVRHCSMIQML